MKGHHPLAMNGEWGRRGCEVFCGGVSKKDTSHGHHMKEARYVLARNTLSCFFTPLPPSYFQSILVIDISSLHIYS